MLSWRSGGLTAVLRSAGRGPIQGLLSAPCLRLIGGFGPPVEDGPLAYTKTVRRFRRAPLERGRVDLAHRAPSSRSRAQHPRIFEVTGPAVGFTRVE